MTIKYWQDALARIRKIRIIDRNNELVFGSKWHKYEPCGPVSEKDIECFEESHSVKIPHDYRTFLLVIGGGPGPHYGIYSFTDVKSYSPNVGQKFTLTESTEWPESDDDPMWDFPGLLNISTSGCATDWFIEVNGNQPGTMWVDSGSGYQLAKMESFKSWYSAWLDRIEKGLLAYLKLETLVKANATLSCIEKELNIEAADFNWDGVTYKRFNGIPGRVTLYSGTAVLIDTGPCWIT